MYCAWQPSGRPRRMTARAAAINAERFSPPSHVRLVGVLTGWLNTQSDCGDIEGSTIATYQHLIETILVPWIGHLRAAAITAAVVEALHLTLILGDELHGPYARSTVRQVLIILRGTR